MARLVGGLYEFSVVPAISAASAGTAPWPITTLRGINHDGESALPDGESPSLYPCTPIARVLRHRREAYVLLLSSQSIRVHM